jgi:hypothetical protein
VTRRSSFVLTCVLFAAAIAPATHADSERTPPSRTRESSQPARPHPATVGVGLELNRVLRQSRARTLDAAQTTAEITSLGRAALPAALAILEERSIPAIPDAGDEGEIGAERQILSEHQEAQILGALRAMPSSAVVDAARLHLEQRGGTHAPLWARVAVVEAVSACGSYASFGWMCGLVAEAAGSPIDPAVERVVCASLREILARDRGGFSSLTFDWQRLPRALLPTVVNAAGADGDPRALPMLGEVIAQSPDLAPLALSGIARQNAPADVPRSLLDELRSLLVPEQAMQCRAACNALAALGDYGSVEALIALLDGSDAGLRTTAHQGLRCLSGMMLPPEASGWKCWFERERRWYADRGPALAIALETGTDGDVLEALAEIAEHHWDRHRISQLAAGVLTRNDRAVRMRACQVLSLLASPRSREPLSALLDDRDAEVAAAARSALESLPPAAARK